MEAAQNELNIVILDACRNNPFARSFRSADKGLAQMDAPSGTIIAYATAPGSVASDGTARNGLYTQELLKNIRTPALSIEEVFKQVRISVRSATGGKQTPWESSSLTGNFYFAGDATKTSTFSPIERPVSRPQPTFTEPTAQSNVEGPSANADAPPLQRTMEWLGAMLIESSFYRSIFFRNGSHEALVFQPEGKASYTISNCTLTLNGSRSENNELFRMTAVIPFADMATSSIRSVVQDGTIDVQTTGYKRAFKIVINNEETYTSRIAFTWDFEARENMPRLEKAIRNAIKLCGDGNAEPF